MGYTIRTFLAALMARAGLCGLAVITLGGATAAAEPPIWLIEDEDSTLYLFGTVHLLDPDIEWRTERVEQALDAATELWMEVALPPTMAELQAQVQTPMLRYALSPDEPLSSRPSDEEQAQLHRAIARTENPEQMAIAGEDVMDAWIDYDVAVAGRNEDWAGRIETLLSGEGVAFIAVGAGHLIGPDSVQAQLAERGIRSQRYE